jgi:hypothetical protein
VTIGLFPIVVNFHGLPLWFLPPLLRYDDTFSTNACIKIIVNMYSVYAVYYTRICGGWQSYRRIVVKKKSKHQADVFSDDDDFESEELRR